MIKITLEFSKAKREYPLYSVKGRWNRLKSIRTKLLLPIFFMFIFFSSVMVTQINSIHNNLEQINDINDKSFTTLLKAERLKQSVIQVQQWLTDISATRASGGLDDGFDEAAKHAEIVQNLLADLAKINPDSKPELEEIAQRFDAYYETGKKMAQAYIDGGPTKGNLMMAEFDSTATAINSSVDVFVTEANRNVEDAITRIEKSIFNTILLTVVSIVVSFLIFFLAWFFTTKKVYKPIKRLLEKLEELSNNGGDLTQQIIVDSRDEIGQLANATNKFINNVHSIVTNVMQTTNLAAASSEELAASAEQMGQASSQITVMINEVSDGAAEQSGHAKNILTMMEQAVSDVSTGREQMVKNLTIAKKSTQYALEGERAINEAVIQFKTVTQTVSHATESVQKLGSRSAEIGSIITAISNIADQTNLLALNAAIEAARAGETGKGFAVVADEVRKLAEQSSQSSAQITELIKHIQAETANTIQLMEKNVSAVEDQVRIIEKSRNSLQQIVNAVAETELETAGINDILISVKEKSETVLSSIQKVSSIIEHSASKTEDVAAISEEQNATVEEIVSSTAELAQVAEQLQNQINRFTI